MSIPTIEDAYNEINARGIPENFIQYCQMTRIQTVTLKAK